MTPTPTSRRPGLRELKQRRTRQAITAAAIDLFAVHGFDGVTVADIVERAEVGRSTFFRYFDDKQDVLFGDDGELRELLIRAARATVHPAVHELSDALEVARSAMSELTRHVVTRYGAQLAARDRIVQANEALVARSLLKRQRHVHDLAGVLVERGASRGVAVLAAHLALACYAAAQDAGGSPEGLPEATERAFRSLLATIDHGTSKTNKSEA